MWYDLETIITNAKKGKIEMQYLLAKHHISWRNIIYFAPVILGWQGLLFLKM